MEFAAPRMRMFTGAPGLARLFPAFPSEAAAAPQILWGKLHPFLKHLHACATTAVSILKRSCDL